MSGLTVITDRGTVEVPQSIEAEGGAAIEAYVAQQLAAPTPPTLTAAESPETPPTPAEGSES
jgi:hypothetical protein